MPETVRKKHGTSKKEEVKKPKKVTKTKEEKPKKITKNNEKQLNKEEKPKLSRQNSATLRKYGNVYESMNQNKVDKKVKKLDKKMEKLEVKEKKKEEKPKRKLNPYQTFFKEQRLAGKTPTEIGALWKKYKEQN
jgi:hypothetical protein